MGPSTSYLLVPRCKGKRETKKGKDSFCKMGFVLCLLRFELQNISFRITNHIFSRLLTLNKIQFNVKPEDEIEDDMICDERSRLATAIPTIKIMVGLWLSLNPKE